VRALGATDSVRLRKVLHHSLDVSHRHSPNHGGSLVADDVGLPASDADVETTEAIRCEIFVWDDRQPVVDLASKLILALILRS
jgi:hypothetical protein